MANTAAVDATIYTKGDAIVNYAESKGISLEQIAGIGDELIDISFLTTKGLGLAGTVGNAQTPVKEAVFSMPRGFISSKEVFDGFLEFYEYAREGGFTHIVSDRDGVLLRKGDYSRGSEFKKLIESVGMDSDGSGEKNPHIAILTGSSYGQNIGFTQAYGLDSSLSSNPVIRADPFLLLAENGLIHINILTGETKNLCSELNPELLEVLKNRFEPEVAKRIERDVLPSFGLGWSFNYNDQNEKIFVPEKQGMTTFNIPGNFADGRDYRESEEAEMLRCAMIDIMREVAEKIKIPYEVVEG
jgi:hypothetical protein